MILTDVCSGVSIHTCTPQRLAVVQKFYRYLLGPGKGRGSSRGNNVEVLAMTSSSFDHLHSKGRRLAYLPAPNGPDGKAGLALIQSMSQSC